MPFTIPRREAMVRVKAGAFAGVCPMCHVSQNAPMLFDGEHTVVTLNRYPLRWGHLLVVTKRHVETFEAITDDEHTEASGLCLRAARALERGLAPPRVFVAALGSARDNLPMTCPHLHWHVIPVAHGERPRDVLTWRHGVISGTDEEWAEIGDRLCGAFLEAGAGWGSASGFQKT